MPPAIRGNVSAAIAANNGPLTDALDDVQDGAEGDVRSSRTARTRGEKDRPA